MYGGGGFLSLLFWGVFAVIMLQVVQGVFRNMTGQRGRHSAAPTGCGAPRHSVQRVHLCMSNTCLLHHGASPCCLQGVRPGPALCTQLHLLPTRTAHPSLPHLHPTHLHTAVARLLTHRCCWHPAFLKHAGGDDGYSYGSGGTEGYEEVVTVAKVQVGIGVWFLAELVRLAAAQPAAPC